MSGDDAGRDTAMERREALRVDRKTRAALRKRGKMVRLAALHSPGLVSGRRKNERRSRRLKKYGGFRTPRGNLMTIPKMKIPNRQRPIW